MGSPHSSNDKSPDMPIVRLQLSSALPDNVRCRAIRTTKHRLCERPRAEQLLVLVDLDGFVPLMNLLERQSELVSYKTSINTHDIFTAHPPVSIITSVSLAQSKALPWPPVPLSYNPGSTCSLLQTPVCWAPSHGRCTQPEDVM